MCYQNLSGIGVNRDIVELEWAQTVRRFHVQSFLGNWPDEYMARLLAAALSAHAGGEPGAVTHIMGRLRAVRRLYRAILAVSVLTVLACPVLYYLPAKTLVLFVGLGVLVGGLPSLLIVFERAQATKLKSNNVSRR